MSSYTVSGQVYFEDILPGYRLDANLDAEEGITLYAGTDQLLYYASSEDMLWSQYYEAGVCYREGGFLLNPYWRGSLFLGETEIPEVDNIELVLDESEMGIYSNRFFQGGGFAWESSLWGGDVSLLGSNPFARVWGRLPISHGLYTGISGGYEPILMAEGTLLEDQSFPLALGRRFLQVDFGRDVPGSRLSLSYFISYALNSEMQDEEGFELDFHCFTPLGMKHSGQVEADCGLWSWDILYSQSFLYAEGTHREEDYDSIISFDAWEGYPFGRLKGEASLVLGEYSLGVFGEGFYFSEDWLVVNAPSTVVTTNYVYRYIFEDADLAVANLGIMGKASIENDFWSLAAEGSVSCLFSYGTGDIFHVYGIPLVSITSHDWDDETYNPGLIFMNLGGEGTLHLGKADFWLSLEQLVPLGLDLSLLGEFWGGSQASCGISFRP